ncbi:MAG: hypothetical protein ABR567_01595 [Myxococcales bacterium]|nr:hypothetical protein [Myxococcales bacterium]
MKPLLLVLAAACASAPKAPPAAPISSYSGRGCVELAAIRPMPLDAARALVPPGYKLAPGQDGLAQMSFALYRCDSFAIDGAPVAGGVVGENSIRVESPDGSAGRHAYLLHHVTTLKPLAEALGALSEVFELAVEGALDVGPRAPGGANVARGSIRSARFEATFIGDPVTEPADGPVERNSKGVTFWLDRGGGRIELDYSSQILPRSTGRITVRSGGADSTATGAFLRFEPSVRIIR